MGVGAHHCEAAVGDVGAVEVGRAGGDADAGVRADRSRRRGLGDDRATGRGTVGGVVGRTSGAGFVVAGAAVAGGEATAATGAVVTSGVSGAGAVISMVVEGRAPR